MKTYSLILIAVLALSCNKAFLVSQENVIKKKKGILLLPKRDAPEFITSDVDTSLTVSQNLVKQRLGMGYWLFSIQVGEQKSIMPYADSINDLFYAVPVILSYVDRKELVPQHKREICKIYEHYIRVGDKTINYKIKQKNFYVINIAPVISAEKRFNAKDPYEFEQEIEHERLLKEDRLDRR